MVDQWKYTGLHSTHFYLRRSAAGMYSTMWGTPSQGTFVDYGRIFLYFPWLDGSGPQWSHGPQLWAYDGSRALVQDKMRQSMGHHCPSSSSGNTPPCSQETLEHIAWSKPDSKTLECLVWSVYDGLLSPGPTPKLTGPKSYNQVTRCLAAKVFRGLQVHCLMRTSAQFDELTPVRVWSVIFVTPLSKMARKTEAMNTASQKVESTKEGAVGEEADTDPDRHPMAWMRNHQCCYDDKMISFWPLLRPLRDGGGTMTQCLVHHLLSTWQWSSVTHPTFCPPAPTNMEIRWWLPLDWEGSREDLWIEAYVCCLQCMAEASARRSWVTGGEGMAPQVSPLVQAFLSTMGRHVSPSILRECWLLKHDIVPRQPMNEVRARITYCLDQVAMWSPSTITWDIFTWPESNKSYWKEDCLLFSPGSMVDLSSRMPGVQLVLHNEGGKYQGVARFLKYEEHMLVYDPQTNGMGWVAMRGIPLHSLRLSYDPPLAINMAMVLCHTHHDLPSHPNQHGDWAMAAPGLRGKQGRSVHRGLCLLLTTCGRSISWTFLGNRGWRNGSTGQPSHTGIPICHGKTCKPIHSEGVLAAEARYCTKAAYEWSPGSYNLLPGSSSHVKPFNHCMGHLRMARI